MCIRDRFNRKHSRYAKHNYFYRIRLCRYTSRRNIIKYKQILTVKLTLVSFAVAVNYFRFRNVNR